MPSVNANDRASLERVYPADAFASDAARNERASHDLQYGVRIGSAPDADGCFELERAARHSGEPPTATFLAPARRTEELVERGHHAAPRQVSAPEPDSGYRQFLDDIVAVAQRAGFRAEDSPGRGEPRLKGLRGG